MPPAQAPVGHLAPRVGASLNKGLKPVKKWTPAKVKAVVQASMALAAMVGVAQDLSFWEIRVVGIKHSPIYLVYAEDFHHGVTIHDGRIAHHADVSKDQIGEHFYDWAEMGAIE